MIHAEVEVLEARRIAWKSAWIISSGWGQAVGALVARRPRVATLLRQLPEVADAVLTGQISQAGAAVLTRLIGHIELAELPACQSSLIDVATGRDPQALAGWVRELIATHCELQLDHDERTAKDKRYLQTRNQHDGTLIIDFGRRLPAPSW